MLPLVFVVKQRNLGGTLNRGRVDQVSHLIVKIGELLYRIGYRVNAVMIVQEVVLND